MRLEGSQLQASLLRTEQVGTIVEAFRRDGERGGDVEKNVRHYLAQPGTFECRFAITGDKAPVAFLVQGRATGSIIQVPLFRLANHSLAPTVGRHLLRSLIESASRIAPLVKVTDTGISEEARLALIELGFVPSAEGWCKISVGPLAGAEGIKEAIRECGLSDDVLSKIVSGLNDYAHEKSIIGAAQLEKVFWPAKLVDAEIPTFIVPIQAQWAQHFFDSELGSELLFGLNNKLHLGIEGAYYCSKRNTLLQSPGRVLWYVSKGPEGKGSMMVKACSRIEEVFIGKPKEVFKKFNRLGVYHWRDILKTVGGNIDEPLLAFRFSMTERFVNPVELGTLESFGIAPPIMSARRISPKQFSQVYRCGKTL